MTLIPVPGNLSISMSAAGASSSPMVLPMSFCGASLPLSDHLEHRRVTMRLHAMAAADLDLMGNDLVHRNACLRMLAQHQTDLQMPAAPAQASDRVEAGHGRAQGVHRDMSAALRDLLHSADYVFAVGRIHALRGAQASRQGQLVFGDIDRDHISAHGICDHDRREADAARAMHCQPFTRSDAALIDNRAKGGDEPAAESSPPQGKKAHPAA